VVVSVGIVPEHKRRQVRHPLEAYESAWADEMRQTEDVIDQAA